MQGRDVKVIGAALVDTHLLKGSNYYICHPLRGVTNDGHLIVTRVDIM